mgnify:CR=1 FL=1
MLGCEDRKQKVPSDRFDVDADFECVGSSAENDATHGADVVIVAADADRNMVGFDQAGIGRIESEPADRFARIDLQPSMGFIGTDKSFFALRRSGAKVAADVAGRQADRS